MNDCTIQYTAENITCLILNKQSVRYIFIRNDQDVPCTAAQLATAHYSRYTTICLGTPAEINFLVCAHTTLLRAIFDRGAISQTTI